MSIKTYIIRNIFLFLTSIIIFNSCSGYQKLLKSSDTQAKYKRAIEYFEKEDYSRATALLENVLPFARGTDIAEDVDYYLAEANFRSGDYILAGYYFGNFAGQYPNSSRQEEALFKNAYCYFLDSPRYSLDQSNTHQAIEAFQRFINKFPSSDKVKQSNEYIDKLRAKLERKSFETSKLYYNLGDYQAAVINLNNTLDDFPDTKYRENIYYLIFKSNYLFSKKSIVKKQAERYQKAIESYNTLIKSFPETKYKKETTRLHGNIVKRLKELAELKLKEMES